MKRGRWVLFCLFAYFIQLQLLGSEPVIVYLSWLRDPTTTMVVQWLKEGKPREWTLYYKEKSEESSQKVSVASSLMREDTAYLQRIELTGLRPASEYEFWLEERRPKKEPRFSKIYRFRTMPGDLSKPVRFVVGGDVYFHYELFRTMNEVVVKQDPAFVVLGGDIAYAYGHKPVFAGENWDWERWRGFLRVWADQMVDSEGRLIPFACGSGES